MRRADVSISLCMIVKDEEATLPRCLASIGGVPDEIVIVDTGSSDGTRRVAADFTPHVHNFAWRDDFASARNASFAHATKCYVMWLDADDVLLKTDREKLLALKASLDPCVDAVSMRYNLAVDGEGNVTFSSRRHRLVRRAKGFRWHGEVHEYLDVSGNVLHSDVAVTHRPAAVDRDPGRNLRIYERRLARGEALSPRDLFYYANECFEHGMYRRASEHYEKFLATRDCWVEDAIAACGRLADCALHLGDEDGAITHALRSVTYDVPRAEICCRLGFMWMKRQQWEKAAFWYRLATEVPQPGDGMGFTNEAAATWLPHIQLCVCYDRMGDYRLAYEHNERAGGYRPHDPQVLHNKRYLESVRGLTP